jgi:thiamine biosynthesis lipoprotein
MSTVTAGAPRTVHIEHCMGTVFTIDIRDAGTWDDATGEVVAWLHHVDSVFSTYKDDSDISLLRRGELSVARADPDVGPVLDLCRQLEVETGGYFSPNYQRELDPTGLVKGWAIERASHILHAHGSHNHGVNGGGDIQIAGESAPGQPWTIGISDPLDNTRVLTTVTGRNFAIATSGIAERGAHIINPRTGRPAEELVSVTVTGWSLTRVDAYATAAFAMGPDAIGWIEAQRGHQALIVTPDGRTAATTDFRHVGGRPLISRRRGRPGRSGRP